MNVTRWRWLWAGVLAGSLGLESGSLRADERRFTYVYEPETLPAGAFEVENWVTYGTGRNATVGQENYQSWGLRQELEYGVSDRYTVALYLNEAAESYRDPANGDHSSSFDWKGVSLENRFNLVNPAAHALGVTLYLEGRYSGDEAAVEEKIIIGQRYGAWKWALNLSHETEWEEELSEVEGEVAVSLGLARDLGNHWSLGLEVLNENLLPEYKAWESSALFVGPVLGYRQERWWAALTVMPQVYGWNNSASQDGNRHLELVDHERLNVRLLFGFNF